MPHTAANSCRCQRQCQPILKCRQDQISAELLVDSAQGPGPDPMKKNWRTFFSKLESTNQSNQSYDQF